MIGRKFLMFSCVDILRYNRLDKDVYNHSLTKYVLTLCEFPAKQIGEFHLSTALVRFYAVIHGVEDEESVEEKPKIDPDTKMIEMYKPTGKVTKQMSLLENSKPDLEPKSSGSDQVWFISGSGRTQTKAQKINKRLAGQTEKYSARLNKA